MQPVQEHYDALRLLTRRLSRADMQHLPSAVGDEFAALGLREAAQGIVAGCLRFRDARDHRRFHRREWQRHLVRACF